jgi:hypothetical protein
VQIFLTPRLPVPLAVAVALLLALLVCQPSTGLRLLLVVATLLLLPFLVCQPSRGLGVLLAVAVLLLLPGCGGHAVQIVVRMLGGLEASKALGQNLISPSCPSPVPSPLVLA